MRDFVDNVEMTRVDKLYDDLLYMFADVKQVIQPIEYRNNKIQFHVGVDCTCTLRVSLHCNINRN